MDFVSEWKAAQVVDLDAQKSAQLSARLVRMGFSNTQVEKACASVKESGAFDAMDTKPSSVGSFFQSIKTLVTKKDTSNVTAQSVDTELANSL